MTQPNPDTDLENLISKQLAGQSDSAVTPDPNAGSGGSGSTDTSGTPETQGEGGTPSLEDQLGPKDLPPELENVRKLLFQDYHKKTQALSEQRKALEANKASLEASEKDSKLLSTLMQEDWFRKAYNDEKQRREGGGPAKVVVSDDDKALLASGDANAIVSVVTRLTEQMLEQKIGPRLSAHQRTLQDIEADREFEAASRTYGEDFDKANEAGLLDPYLKAGFDPATAFEKLKFKELNSNFNSQLKRKAEEIINDKKSGSISKPGGAQIQGNTVLKAKDLDGAMDQLFDALGKGMQNVVVQTEKGG